MFFQIDATGDKNNGVKSVTEACVECGVDPVPRHADQKLFDYCFEFHSSMHGDAVVYVNHTVSGDRINRSVPAILLGPPPTWQRGKDTFKAKDAADALNTVTNNQALFQALYDGWNT